MPRPMPRFDLTLQAQARLATGIVAAGETMRKAGGQLGRSEWTLLRVEALYELAYLRLFAGWEWCLESIFFRSLCGYASRAGQEVPVAAGGYYSSIAVAETAVLGGAQFLLWHNPQRVVTRCQAHIRSGPGYLGRQEA